MNANNIQPLMAATAITIRPIRIKERGSEAEFLRHLSPQSNHYHFLGSPKELTPEILTAFRDLNRRHSVAFVATVREDGKEFEVGASCYAPNINEDVREMEVTVNHHWLHKGIGALLTEKVMEFAKGHGVKRIYSVDLTDNRTMRQLADDLGMTAQRDPDDVRQVIYSLTL